MLCRRCGRTLTDPQSISRGYGPTCWKRVQIENERDYQDWLTEMTTIIDPATATETFQRIENRIRVYMEEHEATCICGEPLRNSDLLSFDHGAGVLVPGYGQPQWIFLRCPACQNELSIWKLRDVSIDDILLSLEDA